MRIVHLDDRVIGMKLGQTIHDRAGRVLLAAGVVLTQDYVRQLRQRGYLSIPVMDPLAPDAVPGDALREETRRAAMNVVAKTLERMRSNGVVTPQAVQLIIDRILAEIRREPNLALNVSMLRNLDDGLFVHSVNVCVYSLLIAASLGIPPEDQRPLGIGALLHDIGKVFYMELVQKRGRLTPEEYERIQQHARDGYDLLRRQPGMPILVAHVAYQHHERLDGSGYPRGLSGEAIHPWARITAVADIYDTITADRTYGLGQPPHEAMAEVRAMAEEGKLDARAVRALMGRLAVYPEGTILLTAAGEMAIVIGQTEVGSAPRVRVVTDGELNLRAPEVRVMDGSSPETTVRSVLADYPIKVLEQLERMDVPSPAQPHNDAAPQPAAQDAPERIR
ncbi:MAG: HD-GYP domain-containing protein [Firmicutes bacterium]|nr:HD-GYP domain-containing protein [Bacillota bacterium]